MIITRLTGGLGNQMFQYAAGLALATARDTALKLDLGWFSEPEPRKPHERFGLSCFQLAAEAATPGEIARVRATPPAPTAPARLILAVARRLRLRGYVQRRTPASAVRYDGDFGFARDFSAWTAPAYLHGNWQSERYFSAISPLVRARFAFRQPLPAALESLAARIAARPAICVHVRRGDYVHDPVYARDNGALGRAYYQRALGEARERVPDAPIFVFSDDVDGAARELGTTHDRCEFVREPPGTAPHDTLRLMSLARHFVIANSTLSWWAAWLGRAKDSAVFAPEPWFAAGSRNGRDIVPEEWIRLPRAA